MLKLNPWYQPVGVLASAAIVVTGMAPAVTAELEPSQPVTIAQGGLIGQCRQTNKPTPVYETRGGTNPQPVETLAANTKVTLSDNGQAGLIGINKPLTGFISAANLKPCSDGTTNPPVTPPTGDACRRVINPKEGLVIRSQASANSAQVGGVAYNATITLTTTPATSRKGPDGRNWIEISAPAKGWVSNGFPGSKGNLIYCK